ncbi:MAG: hypothetical protein OXJ52_06905 [Oligoflexia bacterium]|nr:hypothetical protein [Oligoflexia bacterium]
MIGFIKIGKWLNLYFETIVNKGSQRIIDTIKPVPILNYIT